MISQVAASRLEKQNQPQIGEAGPAPELAADSNETAKSGLGDNQAEPTALALVEMLLKNPAMVDRLNREPTRQKELFPRFLLIALTSYLIYGILMVLILNLAPAAAHVHSGPLPLPPAFWSDGTAWSLPLAYTVGMVLAACVCLPCFYFYSLLAGVQMSWLQITSVIGKGMAANAIMLLGLVPIYVIVALGAIIFAAPTECLQVTLGFGLLLPFVSGLWGLRAIFLGIMHLTTVLPAEWQCRRRCFLRRLIASWTVLYAAVVPVMIYRLWEYFAFL